MTMDNDLAAVLGRIQQRMEDGQRYAAQWDEWVAANPIRQTCPNHRDVVLEVDRERAVAESFNAGKMLYRFKDCPKCRAEVTRSKEADRLARQGVPDNLAHCNLENWTPTSQDDAKRLAVVKEYAASPRGFLVIIGKDFGVGKSHLAVAVLRAFGKGRFVTQNGFLRELRKTYGNPRAVNPVDLYGAAPLLVLDEVGLSSGGQDEIPALHEMLSRRYAERLPTVLTGNIEDATGLADIFGARMLDRLAEATFASILLRGPSSRPARREMYLRG